jgi:hypothetical protein
MRINSWKLKRWTVYVIALVSFGAGSLITARLAHKLARSEHLGNSSSPVV